MPSSADCHWDSEDGACVVIGAGRRIAAALVGTLKMGSSSAKSPIQADGDVGWLGLDPRQPPERSSPSISELYRGGETISPVCWRRRVRRTVVGLSAPPSNSIRAADKRPLRSSLVPQSPGRGNRRTHGSARYHCDGGTPGPSFPRNHR